MAAAPDFPCGTCEGSGQVRGAPCPECLAERKQFAAKMVASGGALAYNKAGVLVSATPEKKPVFIRNRM